MEQIINNSKTRGRLIDHIRKASSERLVELAGLLGIEVAYINPKRVDVKVIQGGVIVDGIRLVSNHCDCTGIRSHCCSTYSRVEIDEGGKKVHFKGNATSGYTSNDYNWGYTVRKDGWTVEVEMCDTQSSYSYAGQYPPDLKEFVDRGWEVVEEYDTSCPEED